MSSSDYILPPALCVGHPLLSYWCTCRQSRQSRQWCAPLRAVDDRNASRWDEEKWMEMKNAVNWNVCQHPFQGGGETLPNRGAGRRREELIWCDISSCTPKEISHGNKGINSRNKCRCCLDVPSHHLWQDEAELKQCSNYCEASRLWRPAAVSPWRH